MMQYHIIWRKWVKYSVQLRWQAILFACCVCLISPCSKMGWSTLLFLIGLVVHGLKQVENNWNNLDTIIILFKPEYLIQIPLKWQLILSAISCHHKFESSCKAPNWLPVIKGVDPSYILPEYELVFAIRQKLIDEVSWY